MVRINIEYMGDLHTTVTHEPSGHNFTTDAPTDNQGKGEFISPTDLLAASIGSCIATIMGISAKNRNIDLKGMKISVTKEMIKEPVRRIGKLYVDIVFPNKLSDEEFDIFAKIVKTCPVTKSLHPDIELITNFSFA